MKKPENLIFEIIENDDILSNIGISDSAGADCGSEGRTGTGKSYGIFEPG